MKNERQIYKKICIQNFKNHPKNIVLKQQHSFNKNSKNKNILPNKQKAQLLLITNNNILYEKTSFSSCSSNTERVKLCSSHQNLSVNSINNSIKRSYMLSNKKRVIKIPTAKKLNLSNNKKIKNVKKYNTHIKSNSLPINLKTLNIENNNFKKIKNFINCNKNILNKPNTNDNLYKNDEIIFNSLNDYMFLNNKTETMDKDNIELISNYENIIKEYQIKYQENNSIINKINKIKNKLCHLKKINEELSNNYNTITNDLIDEKNSNEIDFLKLENKKLLDKLKKYDVLIAQLKNNINLLSHSRENTINRNNNLKIINSLNENKIEELQYQKNMKIQELEKCKSNLDIINDNNIKLQKDIDNLINKKEISENKNNKEKNNSEIELNELTKKNKFYLKKLNDLHNQIEKINKKFEKIKNTKKIKKNVNFEIYKLKYMELKNQNEKHLKEIQKYNSIINNLVTANKNMSDMYNNRVLSLKEVYNEINKKNNGNIKEKEDIIKEEEKDNYSISFDEEKVSDYNDNYENYNVTISDN